MKRSVVGLIALMMAVMPIGSTSSFAAKGGPQSQSDLLSVLPDGIGAVSVDVSQLTSSALWTSLTSSDKSVKYIQRLQADLADIGLNLADIKQAAVCLSAPNTNGLVEAINGSIDQTQVLTKLRANPKVKLTSQSYKNQDVYTAVITNKTGTHTQNMSFAFVGGGAAILGSVKGVRAGIDAAKGDKPSLAQDSKVQAGLAEAGAGAIRFAVVNPAQATELESSSLPLPDLSTIALAFGTVGVTSAIDLNVTLRNDTADHATAMANQLTSLLAMAKGFLGSSSNPKNQVILDAVKTVAITQSGTDVKFTGNVSGDLLSKVIH
jgi:hypothetical protein